MKSTLQFYFCANLLKDVTYRFIAVYVPLILSVIGLPSFLMASDIEEIGSITSVRADGGKINHMIYSSTEKVASYEKRLRDLLPHCHFNLNEYMKQVTVNQKIEIVSEKEAKVLEGDGILHTDNINTCRAVSLWHPALKAGILAHLVPQLNFQLDDAHENMNKKVDFDQSCKAQAKSERRLFKKIFEYVENISQIKLNLSQFQVTVVVGHLTDHLFWTCENLMNMGLNISHVYYNPVVSIYLECNATKCYLDLNRLVYNSEKKAYLLKDMGEQHWTKNLTLDVETGDFWVEATLNNSQPS